ncbi:MarR family transcriptional regulator [Actinomycetospora chlora]|uniref:MarR family transcriptional regulator n=1 Tax=Actinomycetospora chlora TaxID=663608 RepID=A0ABP9C4V8_9PSEU
MTEAADPPVMRLVELLDLADRAVEACLARLTASAGLSREQWRALVLLDEGVAQDGVDAPGHTMGEIASRAAVPAPSATRMVDKLVADGFAFRRGDPWDRRRVLVHIAPHGHALVARAASELEETFGSVFADFPAADRRDISALLDRLGVAVGLHGDGRTL